MNIFCVTYLPLHAEIQCVACVLLYIMRLYVCMCAFLRDESIMAHMRTYARKIQMLVDTDNECKIHNCHHALTYTHTHSPSLSLSPTHTHTHKPIVFVKISDKSIMTQGETTKLPPQFSNTKIFMHGSQLVEC